MSSAPINLDSFSDSPYAEELRKGVPRLRFAQPLESAFVRAFLEQMRPRIRLWATVTFAIVLAFSLEQRFDDGMWTAEAWLHFVVYLPITACLTWLAWSREFARLYMGVALVAVPIVQALGAVFNAQSVAHGAGEELAMLALAMIAVFFFWGLLFRAALFNGAVTLAAFALGAWTAGMEAPVFAKAFAMLFVAAAMTAGVAREVELAHRKRFLEGELIGELLEQDELTGLKNRRAFDSHLQQVWSQALRDTRPLAFLFIDVDYFKRYNDEYGHQAGDSTLRRVARVVQKFARRPLDIAARFGGEEFAVILHDAAPAEVAEMAERLRRTVQDLRIEHLGSGCARHVTVSVGVAVVQPKAGRSPYGALQLADEALYKAKDSGRNRCIIEGAAEYDALVTGTYAKLEIVG